MKPSPFLVKYSFFDFRFMGGLFGDSGMSLMEYEKVLIFLVSGGEGDMGTACKKAYSRLYSLHRRSWDGVLGF